VDRRAFGAAFAGEPWPRETEKHENGQSHFMSVHRSACIFFSAQDRCLVSSLPDSYCVMPFQGEASLMVSATSDR